MKNKEIENKKVENKKESSALVSTTKKDICKTIYFQISFSLVISSIYKVENRKPMILVTVKMKS